MSYDHDADPPSPRYLDPALARLAAAHDEIVARYADGTISSEQAEREVSELVARDQDGVLWGIHPATGDWYYQAADGSLQRGEPPTHGVAPPSSFELSGEWQRHDPDHHVALFAVDEGALRRSGGLVDSTRGPLPAPLRTRRRADVPVRVVAVAGVALAAAAAAWWALGG